MLDSEVTPTPRLEDRLEMSLTDADPRVIDNRYTVVDRVGAGGMGKVYEAIDTVLQRHVAVKVLPFRDYSDEEFKRFQQEARAVSKLSHPGVVRALDFGLTEKQEPFLVMEFLKGETLDAILKANTRLTVSEFASIFIQIAEAMAHAHSQSVVHRDLKPSNIMICNTIAQPKAFVFDFGIAKIHEDSKSLVSTKTGLVVGSPRYISPEQISGSALDQRSDVYSLGCVMFESLTGSPPFQADSALEIMQMHLNEEPPRLCEVHEQLSFDERLEGLIAKTLEKKPEHRFQSMSELLKELRSITISSDDLEAAGDAQLEPKPKAQSTKSRLALIGGAVVFVIVSIAVAGKVIEQPAAKPGLASSGQFNKSSDKKLLNVDVPVTVKDAKLPQDFANGFTQDSDYKFEQYIKTGQEYLEGAKKHLKRLRSEEHTSLTNLDLPNENLTTDDWKRLSECKNLKTLSLNHSNLTDEYLIDYLAKLKNLNSLNATNTAISPYGLKKAFKDRRSLKVKVLDCKQFAGVNLRNLSKQIGVLSVYDI